MLRAQDDVTQEADPKRARFRPLDAYPGSLANRTYQALREAILNLKYRPGEALRKREVCEALGVSRSPVAEAIARLAQERLLIVVPQAGTYVTRFSLDEIREGAFLREAIELAAVELLAGKITDDEVKQLKRNLRVQSALVEDGDFAGFYQMDRALHEMLLSFTGFRKLHDVAVAAWVHVDRARQLVLPVPGRVAETLEEHQAIVAALEAHNPERARQAMRYHLGQLMTFILPLEQEHPDLFDPD